MDNIGYLIMNLSKQLKYQLREQLQEIQLTPQQWAVLQQLAHAHRATAVEVGHRLGMDKPTISGILVRMEKKALITKTRSQEDRRRVQLALTDKGKELFVSAKAISDEVLTDFCDPLSAAEQQQLQRILLKMEKKQ